jgi:hypothetical protein
MKKRFRITITNNTNRELRILPGERRILPRASEILEQRFSRPLRIRLAQSDQNDTSLYTTAVTSIYNYKLKFNNREKLLQWKLAVKKDGTDPEQYSQDELMVKCSVGGEDDSTKNVPHGGDDD